MSHLVEYNNSNSNERYLFDLHAHTVESSHCAYTGAVKLVREYVRAGYAGAVITDHYNRSYTTFYKTDMPPEERLFKGYRAAKEEAVKWGFKVFPGLELKFVDSPNEFLIIGADDNWLKDKKYIYQIGLKAFYEKFKNEVLIIQAHPFRRICTPADPRYIDGIEVANGSKSNHNNNNLAYQLWQKNPDLIPISATDAHSTEEIGGAGIYFYDKAPSSSEELVDALRSQKFELAGDKGIIEQGAIRKSV